jgi:2-dehydropantoate 2-reductase
MRVLIYGAGAIGGYLGALLAHSGADVTLVARGATLDAIGERGLQVEWAAGGRRLQVALPTCAPGRTEGRFDAVFVTLKSMQLAAAARAIAAAVKPDGVLVMIQNGLPWWYFEGVDGTLRGTSLRSLDPDGTLAAEFDLAQVVGAVIYKPVMVVEPGCLFVPDVRADRLVIGEIDGRLSPRLDRIAALVGGAGLPVEITADIRAAKWAKLMVNLVWNPLTALTQSPSGFIANIAPAAQLVRAMLAEGAAVAASVGVRVDADPEAELRRVAGNLSQLPSMLQDVRAGRPLEWHAILGAVTEIAGLTGTAVPTLNNIGALLGVLDQRIRTDGAGIAPAATREQT